MKMNDKSLLKVYGDCWGGEAGEWNTSLENKYLEYMFAKFLEENFEINEDDHILNIGIGAGYWDRYLSYKVPNGSLTSIDIDSECAECFKACLANENNHNCINVICSDVISYEFNRKFNLVTMVGSAVAESGKTKEIITKAISLVDNGGALYLQILHKDDKFDLTRLCNELKVSIVKSYTDNAYGRSAEYFKIVTCTSKEI